MITYVTSFQHFRSNPTILRASNYVGGRQSMQINVQSKKTSDAVRSKSFNNTKTIKKVKKVERTGLEFYRTLIQKRT